jgi:HK97 family phage major capsid protein
MPSQRFFAPSPFLEQKAVSLGENFVNQWIDPRSVRVPEQQRLTLRNVIDVRPAGQGSDVAYLKVTPDADTQAEMVPKGSPKPESGIELDRAKAHVETVAATMKVDEADLQDIAGLLRLIDEELSYQVRLLEERGAMWGSGESPELQGIASHADVLEIEGEGSILDFIAQGMTAVYESSYDPNFVVVHPIDWATIITSKAEVSGVYVFGDPRLDPANLRIWGMRAVISNSAVNPETGKRVLLIGDGQRGASLYDRQTISVSLGYVDDDFARNKRTVRVEERVAVAVRAPLAFRKLTTAVGAGTYGTGS